MRVQTLERERHEGDEQVSKLKETVASQNREVSDLLAQVTPPLTLKKKMLYVQCCPYGFLWGRAKRSSVRREHAETGQMGKVLQGLDRWKMAQKDFPHLTLPCAGVSQVVKV